MLFTLTSGFADSNRLVANIEPSIARSHDPSRAEVPHSSSAAKPLTTGLSQQTPSLSPTQSFADDGLELTLADIQDFEMRKMTAQLMAIAPDISVADLYHLLVEKHGRFDVAKQDVVRMSRGPTIPMPAVRSSTQARAATVPLTDPIQTMDVGDKPGVKIDFDDPLFIWDIEAPLTPPPQSRKRKKASQPKNGVSKKKPKCSEGTSKFPRRSDSPRPRAQGLNSTKPSPAKLSKTTKDTSRTYAKALQDFGDYKTKSKKAGNAGDINRGVRETSYDREFIVSDDEKLDNSDGSYSDSEQSAASDVDMMPVDADLVIDMQPEHAYDSDVLSSPSVGKR